MDNYYGRCDPVGVEEIAVWALFEKRLGAYLSTMVDPSDEDRLVLHVPRPNADSGIWPITIRTKEGGTLIEIAYGFDETGCPVDDLGDMPWRIGDTIRARADLRHPGLISVSACGPAAIGLPILGLADHDAIAEGAVGDRAAASACAPYVDPECQDELVALVLDYARTHYDADTELDLDGDIPLERDGMRAWVRVSEGAAVLTVFSFVVSRRCARAARPTPS